MPDRRAPYIRAIVAQMNAALVMPVVLPQLALEQREPDPLERALSRQPPQPLGHRNLLQRPPVPEPRGVEQASPPAAALSISDSAGKPRNSRLLDIECRAPIGEESGSRRAPAKRVGQPELLQEVLQDAGPNEG